MDDFIDSVARNIGDFLGFDTVNMVTVFIVVSMFCRLIAHLIPDDSIGWRQQVRKICSYIGLYASSRITAGVTIADVAKEVAKKTHPDEVKPEVKQAVDERIEEVVKEETLELQEEQILPPAFPGYARRRDSEGNFLPLGAEGEEDEKVDGSTR